MKLTSRDPSPPPVEYVRGGGGIFKDMAVHDLDMARFLMGSEPTVRCCCGWCLLLFVFVFYFAIRHTWYRVQRSAHAFLGDVSVQPLSRYYARI